MRIPALRDGWLRQLGGASYRCRGTNDEIWEEHMKPRAERMVNTARGPVLQGITCRGCGARSFPPARFCRSCHSEDIDVIALAPTGRIEAVGAFDKTAFGEIRLSDGMLVAGGIEPVAAAKVGRSVKFAPKDDIVRFEIVD